MQRLLALAAKYNYGIGSPEENEAVGVMEYARPNL